MSKYNLKRIIVRGGGDLASGVIQKIWRAGFEVLVLEIAKPLTIRRSVALSTAVHEGSFQVEDMKAVLVSSLDECSRLWAKNEIPIMIDPEAKTIEKLKPLALIDAVVAKRNIGTSKDMAPITVALGPGYKAGDDVDIVVETARGHNLGRIITEGEALPNTGIPGLIAGESFRRVVRAPRAGEVRHRAKLGDWVEKGQIIIYVGEEAVPASLTGILRGLIAENIDACAGLKIADIDPRSPEDLDWKTISDKARNIGGGALEACLYMARKKKIALLT